MLLKLLNYSSYSFYTNKIKLIWDILFNENKITNIIEEIVEDKISDIRQDFADKLQMIAHEQERRYISNSNEPPHIHVTNFESFNMKDERIHVNVQSLRKEPVQTISNIQDARFSLESVKSEMARELSNRLIEENLITFKVLNNYNTGGSTIQALIYKA
ncbi:MAG: hypothetical protein GY827_04855 [Cytophagales bacterium]|nr:hypothetical protein [Cytophagales bacterium]